MIQSRLAVQCLVPFAAFAVLAACAAAKRNPPTTLSKADRVGWYWGTQGSRMMPYHWFRALEQADSTALFADEANLTRFGYIAAPPDRTNRLPIGFAIDRQPDEAFRVTKLRWYAGQRGDSAARAEPWIGLNCAACHTAQVDYGGQGIRVDGGPGMGDYDAFVAAADAALRRTWDDAAKFDRFAPRVFAASRVADTPANRAAPRTAMTALIDWQKRTTALNDSPVRPGFARVDAFGHIYNKVVLFSDAPNPIVNASDAPVSYPFLWDIQRQKKVQWNGAAENATLRIAGRSLLDYGAMGRNVGEVLGVFGEVVVTPPGSAADRLRGYRSSVHAGSLDSLERIVGLLSAPRWPAAFPATDPAKAARGSVLFASKCAACHLTPDLQRAGEPIEVMVPFRSTSPQNMTDIWMACNSWAYDGFTGRLERTPTGYVNGTPLGPRAPVVTMLTTTVKGALVNKKGPLIARAAGNFLGIERPPLVFESDEGPLPADVAKRARRARCEAADSPLLAYKARPLDGIWATAPYLHNGSVPTLYDLLLPAAQRPRTFRLGTRTYDPMRVGFAPMASGGFLYQTRDAAGQPADGNANSGHDYGAAQMSDADRWAMVEYLKTL